jgi:hypothetical protein
MIIYNFNGVGVSSTPGETNAPPVVDPNAMPAFAIPLKGLKSIARRNLQIAKYSGTVEHDEFSISYSLQLARQQFRVPALENRFGLFACK